MDKKIEEGNELIATFDGYIQDLNVKDKPYWHPGRNLTQYTYPDGFKYHSSWDWLMPSCKKFDSLNLLDVEYERLCDDIDNAVACYEIKPAWRNLVKAIQWYNTNLTPNN
jgi:hypothetical protein